MKKQKTLELFQGEFEFARTGGKVARDARKAVEAQTGVPVITSKNASQLNQVVANLIESGIPTAEDPKEKK